MTTKMNPTMSLNTTTKARPLDPDSTPRAKTLAAFGGTAVSDSFVSPVSVQFSEHEIAEVARVMRSGQVRQGAECAAFEKEFAEATGAQHAFATCNGTTALQLAYETLIQPGDEVLCPGFTFMATASMIIARGATPVFCEINPDTYTIDPEDAARRITDRTTAITPVHLYGNVADIDALQSLASSHRLAVIYDAAQSHLAAYKGQGIGAFGDAQTYSFYPTKNMTTGEGGMVTVKDDQLAERILRIRDHGMEPGKRYHHVAIGYNYRSTDIAAVIGRSQLRDLPERTHIRQANATRLTELLSHINELTCPIAGEHATHIFHQYTIRLHIDQLRCDRDEICRLLQAEGIGCGVHYPGALTEQPILREMFGESLPKLPVCEKAGREVLCLPIHHALTDAELISIARAVCKVIDVVKLG